MNIRKMIQHYILGESLKEIEIKRILNKICQKSKLTSKEHNFLDLYNETQLNLRMRRLSRCRLTTKPCYYLWHKTSSQWWAETGRS